MARSAASASSCCVQPNGGGARARLIRIPDHRVAAATTPTDATATATPPLPGHTCHHLATRPHPPTRVQHRAGHTATPPPPHTHTRTQPTCLRRMSMYSWCGLGWCAQHSFWKKSCKAQAGTSGTAALELLPWRLRLPSGLALRCISTQHPSPSTHLDFGHVVLHQHLALVGAAPALQQRSGRGGGGCGNSLLNRAHQAKKRVPCSQPRCCQRLQQQRQQPLPTTAAHHRSTHTEAHTP